MLMLKSKRISGGGKCLGMNFLLEKRNNGGLQTVFIYPPGQFGFDCHMAFRFCLRNTIVRDMPQDEA